MRDIDPVESRQEPALLCQVCHKKPWIWDLKCEDCLDGNKTTEKTS